LKNGSAAQAFSRPFFPGGGEQKSYYRPLVTLSFMANAGATAPPLPEPFHRTNALLHACASVLVFALAKCFTRSSLLAAAAGILFAVHPAAAQTVAWVPGRSDGLMAVFALASLWSYIRFDGSGSRRTLGAHLLLLTLALFSKESAIVLVPIAVGYSWLVSKRVEQLKKPEIWLCWLGVVALWFAARKVALGGGTSGASPTSILHNLPMLWISLGKALWPIDLQVLATLQDSVQWPGAIAVLLLALAVMFAPSNTRRPFIWAAIAIPILTLAPALFVNNNLVLDNRLYVPLAGVAVGAVVLVDRFVTTARSRQWFQTGAVLVAFVLARATLSYSRAFESPRAFCEAAVAGSPHLPLAHVNLGSTEFRAGNLDAAEEQFQKAIKLNPRWPIAHNNLGLIYLNRGQLPAAEEQFLAELSNNPNYPKAHYNLGLVLTRTGREQAAAEHFEQVVKLVPTDIGAWGELLKYWGPLDATRAAQIMKTMEYLGVSFHAPPAQ
jgi:tetratricopeptide (TPR) repeat protein